MPPPRLLNLHSHYLPFLHPYLRPAVASLPPLNLRTEQYRPASHSTQGRANRARRPAGKRLGLKRAATELVVPGTIIFRQRGTKWFPGENCGMGRDHTIFAREKGYVVYYRDKWRGLGYGGVGRVRAEGNHGNGGMHFKKFIGIVFNKGDTLPRPQGQPQPRRLGMVAKPRRDITDDIEQHGQQDISGLHEVAGTMASVTKEERAAQPVWMTKGYQMRESNASIGRLMDEAAKKIKSYKRGDRWLAWRKRSKRVKEAKMLKAQKKARKGKSAARAARSGDLSGPK